MTEDKTEIDRHVKAIAHYIVEEDAKRHSAAHGSRSTLEAILARISAEVTKQAAAARK
jgi:hypothetical protein